MKTAPIRYQVLTAFAYVISMAWITIYAPQDAKWPAVIMLHGAFVLGYMIGKPAHD